MSVQDGRPKSIWIILEPAFRDEKRGDIVISSSTCKAAGMRIRETYPGSAPLRPPSNMIVTRAARASTSMSSSSSISSLSVSSSVSSESRAPDPPTPTPRARFVRPPTAPDAAALATNPNTAPRSAAYSPRRCLRFCRPRPGARCAVPPYGNRNRQRPQGQRGEQESRPEWRTLTNDTSRISIPTPSCPLPHPALQNPRPSSSGSPPEPGSGPVPALPKYLSAGGTTCTSTRASRPRRLASHTSLHLTRPA